MADTTDNARVCILCGTDRSRPDRASEEEKRFFQNRRQCNNCGRMRGDWAWATSPEDDARVTRKQAAEAAVVQAAKQWYSHVWRASAEDYDERASLALENAVEALLKVEKEKS